jgi:hypothetical protein
MAGSTRYQVVRPYVTVKLNTFAGVEVRGFYQNAVLPAEADPDDVEKLLRKGMIAEFDGPETGAVGAPHMDPDEAAEGAQAAADAAAEAQRDQAPARSAKKEVWLAFAQSRGDIPAEQLAEMTQPQLADHYLGEADE